MKTLINLLLFVSLTAIQAQNTIEGTLLENNTNNPIAFANIYLPQLEKGTTTDESGHFVLQNLPSGNYKIVFSFIGFESHSKTIQIPISKPLEIALNPSAIEMDAVILSTPFHKLQRENVMKVEYEKVSDLKAIGAITLSDGIDNIAGVESITTGLSIGKPVIRGLSSNRVLVYAQGVRLENQQFGAEHGLGLNDAGIESIEVIKGPASLLYGSDALGGVLYLNPEKFAPINESAADVTGNYYSNTLGYSTNAGYKASGDKFKYLFRGSITGHSDYETPNYRVTNTRFKEQDFKAGLGYQSTQFKTEFRYNVNHSKLGIPEEVTDQSTDKNPLLPYQDITNHIFSSKSTMFFDKSSLEINLGYTYNNRKEFEDEHDHDDYEEHEEHEEHEEAALNMKLKTFNYDMKYHLPVYGKFETIFGVQGMNQVNGNYGEEILIPNAVTNDFGVLGTSHIHFESIDVQLGFRYDYRHISIENEFSKNYNSFNGAAGIKADVFKYITTRFNVSTGFRAPNLSELASDGVHHGTNRYEIGNPDLVNEQNIQLDLALEHNSDHFEFFINGFYNYVFDYIYLAPNGQIIDTAPVYNYLQDNARLYGGEIGFHLHPHPLDWLHFESSFETVTGKQDNGDYLPLIPANSLLNTVRVEYENKWLNSGFGFITLRSTFKQGHVSYFETSTPSYNLLSAGIGGTVSVFNNDLILSISGTNLTNKNYINHLSRLKQDGIYNMGRNISVGVTYQL
ncbi:TonB-dependent receptor [Formosa maritima]|uniref:TonB-dependent receptor n=1 Tax=Formosa maritima TaxID=2592046 RepID=A0A5D0GJ70_9FLAO|nr:TonB-dependent receptor [Formosa maritima]TYA59075.1 TonB-dependent receptor [Formosa maritima]